MFAIILKHIFRICDICDVTYTHVTALYTQYNMVVNCTQSACMITVTDKGFIQIICNKYICVCLMTLLNNFSVDYICFIYPFIYPLGNAHTQTAG